MPRNSFDDARTGITQGKRAKYILMATQLGYPQKVKDELALATSEFACDQIMRTARFAAIEREFAAAAR